MKKASICFCFLLAMTVVLLPRAGRVKANSAQMVFEPDSPFELVAVDSEDIYVRSEELTFEVRERTEYSPAPLVDVTARYNMHNAVGAQTALIGFPYLAGRETDETAFSPRVELNGQPLTAEKLYGGENYGDIHELGIDEILRDISRLNRPVDDIPCTLFSFEAEGEKIEVGFDKQLTDLAYFSDFNGFRTDKKGKQYLFATTQGIGRAFRILVLEDRVTPHVTGGSCQSTVETTVGDFLENPLYNRSYAATRVNKALLDRGTGTSNASFYMLERPGPNCLILLKYEAPFAAGENEMRVSYSSYPAANYYYDPALYTFHYLSLAAKRWAGFENLTVRVKTDLYLKSDVLLFSADEGGYSAFSETLPDQNISFTLCASDAPVYDPPRNTSAVLFTLYLLAIPVFLILVVAVSAVVIVVMVKKRAAKP